jgi:hypothetical protein
MDKVRLEPLERAELIDTLALQGLTYEHIRRAVGAQLGGAATDTQRGRGGLLSLPIPTYDHTLGTLTLSTFSYLELTQGGAALSGGQTAAPEARIVRFNSADADHPNHPLDISGLRDSGQLYTVWARYVLITTDPDARRKWSVSLNAEVSATIATRERERVELRATKGTTSPANSGESVWVQLFTYTVTGGVIAYGTFYHAHSAADTRVSSLEGLDTAARLAMNDRMTTLAFHSGRSYGLIEHLASLRAQLYRLLHKGSEDTTTPDAADTWRGTPRYSLDGAAAELDDHDGRISALNTRTTAIEATLEADLEPLLNEYSILINARMIYNTSSQEASLETVYRTNHPAGVSGLNLSLRFDRTHISGTGSFNGAAFASATEAINLFSRPFIELGSIVSSYPLESAYILNEHIIPISHDTPRDGMTDGGAPKSPRMFSYSRIVRNSFTDYTYPLNTATIDDYDRVTVFQFTDPYGSSPAYTRGIAYALRFGENGDTPTANSDGNIILHIAFNLRLTDRASI